MRSRWLMTAVILGVLAVPGAAQAGGWATVEMSSTPDGLTAGQSWEVDLTIRQHGVTPAYGLRPAILVTERATNTTRTVAARPAGQLGVYRAEVKFPNAGEYTYVIDNDHGQRHTYPPVRIAPASAQDAAVIRRPDDGGEGVPWIPFGVALLAGLASLTLAIRGRVQRSASS